MHQSLIQMGSSPVERVVLGFDSEEAKEVEI